MNPVKLLVTCGMGFIGSNFIRYMLKKHRDVKATIIDNLSIGANPANLKDIAKDSRYRFVKGDIPWIAFPYFSMMCDTILTLFSALSSFNLKSIMPGGS